MVTLKAAAGISHIYTITGKMVMVRSDGTIEVSEEDAKPLIGQGFTKI